MVWLRGGTRLARRLLLVTCLCGLLAAVGCARSAPPQASVRPKPVVPSASFKSQADELAAVLQEDVLSQSYSWEPNGDINAKHPGPGRVYATLSAVSTSPASVVFDVGQYYLGDAAYKAAAQDRQPEPPNPNWVRNRYRHPQKMGVLAGAPVILQTAGGSREGDPSFGGGQTVGLTPVTFEEFTRRFSAHPDQYRSQAGYILTYDADGVHSIVQVYFP